MTTAPPSAPPRPPRTSRPPRLPTPRGPQRLAFGAVLTLFLGAGLVATAIFVWPSNADDQTFNLGSVEQFPPGTVTSYDVRAGQAVPTPQGALPNKDQIVSPVASWPPTNLKEIHMTERDRCIAGVPCWADAGFPDPKAAADFYAGMFGWEVRDV